MSSSTANIDYALLVFCINRKLIQLFNLPPPRTEIISPYGGQYTQNDLNMRRKAEILKYAGNQSSTKTNALTKREKFALLARGNSARAYPSTINVDAACAQNLAQIQYTPSYYSDVPGPTTLLYEDASVPLYMFATNERNYGILETSDTGEFQNVGVPNIEYLPTTPVAESLLLTQIVRPFVNNPYYSFQLLCPIGIHIEGTASSPPAALSFTLSNPRIHIYSGGSLVNSYSFYFSSQNPPQTTKTISVQPTASGYFEYLSFFDNIATTGIPLLTSSGTVYQWYFSVEFTSTAPQGTAGVTALINMTDAATNKIKDNCSVVEPTNIPLSNLTLLYQ